jgi:DtxR family Mn-dependent transcriptional regulator
MKTKGGSMGFSEIMSPSMEDYLERIYMTQQDKGVVRVKDISKLMQVRMPSVNNAISMLKKLDLVIQERYGYIEMTEHGKEVAKKILNRHNILTKILCSIGVDPEVAEKDACCVEHVISEETFSRLKDHFGEN